MSIRVKLVFWLHLGRLHKSHLKPLAIICADENVQWLCGRYAQLRSDLSPLTAWCHLLTPRFVSNLDGVVRKPKLRGAEAAWSGLAIAETSLLAGKPLASIPITGCLASATFAIGRTTAMWSDVPFDAIIERFDSANRLCRGKRGTSGNQARTTHVRSSFEPMWSCLCALSSDQRSSKRDDSNPLVLALKALQHARVSGEPDEARQLASPLLKEVPEIEAFEQLEDMAPEARLKLFDELTGAFLETDAKAIVRRNALALSIGYLATVAAGGTASLSLVEAYADTWPELTGWAYLIGGIGERITWTSGFSGLGRLVARELQRPLRLDDAPTCDFAFDEATVLSDMELKEPLVHLRIKQAKIVSVALFPGVNIVIPLLEAPATTTGDRNFPTSTRIAQWSQISDGSETLLETIALGLWPYLRPLVVQEMLHRSNPKNRGSGGSQRPRRKRKAATNSQLPLRGNKK